MAFLLSALRGSITSNCWSKGPRSYYSSSTDYSHLQYLENKAQAHSGECQVWGHELFLNAVIQRIADLVVYQMGGLVGDTDKMMKRCRVTTYTGTDDGAVHWIKIDDGSEYIIGSTECLGTLIPAEVPHSLLLDSTLGAGGFSGSSGSTNKLSLVLHQVARVQEVLPDVDEIPKAHRSRLEEAIPVGFRPKHHSEHKFEKLVPSEYMPIEASPFSVEGSWLAQEY
ncbi:hypothetical protein Nepgr_028102 [Nepenthes gracilis]|uniref:Uncharacterized protein n=1 Tax=Nepenthes gracilis TaxID=150966 RepID=A0AAD3TBJ8_NEPGR|nr:hypothetical protein Nepgr_028102 [Nepenthes gracilis]